MSNPAKPFIRSSIFRKQLIAITGLVMVGFVIVHLSGNLLIYAGPKRFNDYSAFLHSLGGLLWAARIGLILSFVVHVYLTLQLVRENMAARPQRYEVDAPKGERNFATMTMKYTGLFVVAFLVLHLYDFTFGNHDGPQSVISSVGNDSLGLFGVVWNSFKVTDPIGWARVPIYIIAVSAVGLHLSHGIQSTFQTLGFNHPVYTPIIQKLSVAVGALVAIGFALIPIYVMFTPTPMGL